MDSEWQHDPRYPLRNNVLGYSLSVRFRGQSHEMFIEASPNARDGGLEGEGRRARRRTRKRLGELLGTAIRRAIDAGILPGWPKKVVFATFYGRGDYAALGDFGELTGNMSVVRGTFIANRTKVVVDHVDEKSGIPRDILPRSPRSRRVRATDPSRNQHDIDVEFMDVYAIVAAKTSLAALGQDLGFPKVELPKGYSAGSMATFMEERPEEFRAYARRDALITGLAAERYRRFCRDKLVIARPPRTLGGLGVREFFKTLAEKGIEPDDLFGRELTRTRRYSQATGRVSSVLARVDTFATHIVDQAATDAYHGGRTETYVTGPLAAPEKSDGGGFLYDIDLRSAYPTNMALIGLPNWPAVRLVEAGADPVQFTADTLGFAEVDFECPKGMRFPAFGVRTEHGLIFPRRGRAIATAPEIASALHYGVSVRVLLGAIIPWDQGVRPYEDFVVRMVALRASFKIDGKDTLESKTVKEATNSLYGKHAQGARVKSTFDPETSGSRPMPRSAVTSPALAAFTTGMVRAAVFELMNSIPEGEIVCSVSTDGFLTSALPSQLRFDGPAARATLKARRRLSDRAGSPPASAADELLEIKKRAVEVIALRNRGIVTTLAADGSDPILARAGMKFEPGVDANAALLDLYLNRQPGQKYSRMDFIAPRSQLIAKTDLVKVQREVRLNFEPDMKRRLVSAEEVAVRHGVHAGAVHLATRSAPFETIEEALDYRAVFDSWRLGGVGRTLKTLQDWEDWQDFLAAATARRRSGARVRVTPGGAVASLVRQFLRALTHGAWGLTMEGRQRADIASWLSGLPQVQRACVLVTLNDFKNASRRGNPPSEGAVPATDATLELAHSLLAEFPTLEFTRLFDTGSAVQFDEFGKLRLMQTVADGSAP